MKKIVVIAVLLVLAFVGSARAEMSAQMYTGKAAQSYQVFADAYNNYGNTITDSYVVILDTAANVLTLTGTALGAYITVDPGYASDNVYVFGVADQDIATGAVGRICIRGPHKVFATGGYPIGNGGVAQVTIGGAQIPRVGVLASTSCGATGQATVYSKADGTIGGRLGTFLASDNVVGSVWWIWIDPKVHN